MMPSLFEGKVAIVTGATGVLGSAVTMMLVERSSPSTGRSRS